jgi:hypothetical protein
MLTIKRRTRVVLVAVIMFSLVTMYNIAPIAQAASLVSASDTLSSSDISATNVTHTFAITTGTALTAGQYIQIIVPNTFSNVLEANVTCPQNPASTTKSVAGGGADPYDIRCTVDSGTLSAGAYVITVSGATNPAGNGSSIMNIYTRNGATEIEKAQIAVYILSDVVVTATVNASLTFSLNPVNNGTTINGVVTTGTSTATTVPFGTINSAASTTIGQEIRVSTNASDGYNVTVNKTTADLVTAAAATINSFDNSNNGAGSTTPHAWAAPANQLGSDSTWGHWGLTTDDSDLATDFTASKYAGLNGTAPMTIMSHGGPANGVAQNIGMAKVAYTVEITDLQEAGDYSTNLVYICTPNF